MELPSCDTYWLNQKRIKFRYCLSFIDSLLINKVSSLIHKCRIHSGDICFQKSNGIPAAYCFFQPLCARFAFHETLHRADTFILITGAMVFPPFSGDNTAALFPQTACFSVSIPHFFLYGSPVSPPPAAHPVAKDLRLLPKHLRPRPHLHGVVNSL